MMRQLRSAPSAVIVHLAIMVPLTPAKMASRGYDSSPPEMRAGRLISGPKGRTEGTVAAGAAGPGIAVGAAAGTGMLSATAAEPGADLASGGAWGGGGSPPAEGSRMGG